MNSQSYRMFVSRSLRLKNWHLIANLSVIVLIVWSCRDKTAPNITLGDWRVRSYFLGVARSGAVSFTNGTQAFVGTGIDPNNNPTDDFWMFDQARDQWINKSNFPGVARSGAVGFMVGGKGYVGLGVDGNNNRLKDFYEYTPATNTWRRIADFGGTARSEAVAFSINTKGYVGFGNDLNGTNDLWAYDPTVDSWQKMATFPGSGRVAAIALTIGDMGYIGMGISLGVDLKDWWSYDPIKDAWLRKQDLPGDPLILTQSHRGVGFAINGKGYLSQINGGANVTWEYNPTVDSWTQRGSFEGNNRQYSTGFSLGAKGYITTGNSSNIFYDDLWEFDPTIPQD